MQGERPHEGDALLHATRQFVGEHVEELAQPHLVEQHLGGDRVDGVGAAVDVQQEAGVGLHRAPRQQAGLLGHHRHPLAAAGLGRGSAVDGDRAGGRRFQPGDDPQQRRLATARGPDDADERPALDRQ
jgi:hypothetical protein